MKCRGRENRSAQPYVAQEVRAQRLLKFTALVKMGSGSCIAHCSVAADKVHICQMRTEHNNLLMGWLWFLIMLTIQAIDR